MILLTHHHHHHHHREKIYIQYTQTNIFYYLSLVSSENSGPFFSCLYFKEILVYIPPNYSCRLIFILFDHSNIFVSPTNSFFHIMSCHPNCQTFYRIFEPKKKKLRNVYSMLMDILKMEKNLLLLLLLSFVSFFS